MPARTHTHTKNFTIKSEFLRRELLNYISWTCCECRLGQSTRRKTGSR